MSLLLVCYREAWLSDNQFVTDNNLAYVKPAVIRDKQHYVCSEKSLYKDMY